MVFLFLRVIVVVCISTVFLMAQSDRVATKSNDQIAKETLDATLNALGGAEKIDGIKSLVIKGKISTSRTGPAVGNTTRTGEFEIRIRWPNDYIHINRLPDQTSWSGVSQGKILTWMDPNIPRTDSILALMLWREILGTSHMLIGTSMKSGIRQLTLSSTKKSNVFELSLSPSTDTVSEIEFDSKTGYPSVIRHTEHSAFAGGTTVHQFSNDRFSVDGIMFPRVITITRTILLRGEEKTISELLIEEVRINPNLSLKDFEVPQ